MANRRPDRIAGSVGRRGLTGRQAAVCRPPENTNKRVPAIVPGPACSVFIAIQAAHNARLLHILPLDVLPDQRRSRRMLGTIPAGVMSSVP